MMRRKAIFTLFLLSSFLFVTAQDTEFRPGQPSGVTTFSGSHFSISLIPFRNKKATIEQKTGPYKLGSKSVLGGEIAFDLHYHFNMFYSLRVGVHATATTRNFTFFVPRNDFSPPSEDDLEETGQLSKSADFYVSLPLVIEKRWFRKSLDHWNFALGAKINYCPTEMSEGTTYHHRDGNGVAYPAVRLELEVGNGMKPWLDYVLSGGHTWSLSNNNFIRVNAVANLSNTNLTKGTYKIVVPGKPVSEGSYVSNLSYMGLSIGYTFTGVNKRLVKLHK